jgi:hypothetical protein
MMDVRGELDAIAHGDYVGGSLSISKKWGGEQKEKQSDGTAYTSFHDGLLGNS